MKWRKKKGNNTAYKKMFLQKEIYLHVSSNLLKSKKISLNCTKLWSTMFKMNTWNKTRKVLFRLHVFSKRGFAYCILLLTK